jgi:C4-dicarboxylate transporter DctM subunit
MGSIMPPIVICCYVVAGMAKDIPLRAVFRGGLYCIPSYIIVILILSLFPYATVLILSNALFDNEW